jgi:glycosyltransferase involved in cell wall biosynthesis
VKILQLLSCRGWSSDAYWAAGISVALERAGHEVTLVCKRGTEERVVQRARESGANRIKTLTFASGVKPARDVGDLRQMLRWLPTVDVVHVHRGKEHWLAAMANRLSKTPRPLVRTRHIVQPIRPHSLNRWLYREATGLVVTVTDAIRRQYLAAGLVPPERIVTLPGGVDATRFHPALAGTNARRALSVAADVPLIGLVSGLRMMKGHQVTIDAARRVADAGRHFQMLFIGRGAFEARIREQIAQAGLARSITLLGFVPDLPSALATLDIGLYPAMESDGMSRVLFEYLAVGTPVVASRVGVVSEVLEDGRTARLVPAGEPPALAAAIDQLLSDRSGARALGTAGAALVHTRLSSDRVASELSRLYARLTAREARAA